MKNSFDLFSASLEFFIALQWETNIDQTAAIHWQT